MKNGFNIDIERLMDDLDGINAIGAIPGGGNSRQAFSAEDLAGRAYLIERMEAAGLTTRIDAAGNIFGRREATAEPSHQKSSTRPPAPLLVGSHIDTIPRGGRFDGVLGVFGALECVRTIDEAGVGLPFPIEVVAFSDEEERFLGFLGSYALTGAITYEDIADCTDSTGERLVDAMKAAGLDPNAIANAAVPQDAYRGFIELHIEQGPLLEREEKTIGVVDGVKGNYRWGVTVVGRTDHAGAPLGGRNDAFVAFQRIVGRLTVFRDTRGDQESTLTIGRIDVRPNIETAQPGWIDFSVDLRSPDKDFLRAADTELSKAIAEVSQLGGCSIERKAILIEDPVAFDPGITGMIQRAAESRRYPWRTMQSGAGHDAQVIARKIPAAMIFVPSVDGRSHCPEEFTRRSDIEAGINTLLDTIIQACEPVERSIDQRSKE